MVRSPLSVLLQVLRIAWHDPELDYNSKVSELFDNIVVIQQFLNDENRVRVYAFGIAFAGFLRLVLFFPLREPSNKKQAYL